MRLAACVTAPMGSWYMKPIWGGFRKWLQTWDDAGVQDLSQCTSVRRQTMFLSWTLLVRLQIAFCWCSNHVSSAWIYHSTVWLRRHCGVVAAKTRSSGTISWWRKARENTFVSQRLCHKIAINIRPSSSYVLRLPPDVSVFFRLSTARWHWNSNDNSRSKKNP